MKRLLSLAGVRFWFVLSLLMVGTAWILNGWMTIGLAVGALVVALILGGRAATSVLSPDLLEEERKRHP